MLSRSERWNIGAGKYNKEQLKCRHDDYAINPDKCSSCNCEMPYAPIKERTKRKFCNKSCAAKYNNQNRLLSNIIYQKGLTKEANCTVCGTIFKIGKNASIQHAKCLDCKTRKIKIKKCKLCNNVFETTGSRLSCSVECSTILKQIGSSLGGRVSASRSIKRSRDEIQLYNLCKGHFKSVRHNEVIKDGWDADIIIDDYQIAVLWNGPWHYKQLTLKNHSLSQVQTRDKIKLNVLESAGWRVITFEDRHYTPDSAFNALKEMVAGAGFEPFMRVLVASTL